MKKLFAMLLALCVLCAAGAAAAEPVAEYDANEFRMTLPEGEWYSYEEGGTTFYYGDADYSMEHGMIMVLVEREDSLVGQTLTDDYYDSMYTALLQSLTGDALSNTVQSENARTAGIRSMIYSCRQNLEGGEYATAGVFAVIDARLLAVIYVHPARTPGELMDDMRVMNASIRYGDAATTAQTVLTEHPEITPEDPVWFELRTVKNQNMVTAQWMMNESTRAGCTMLLSLDLYVSDANDLSPSFDLMSNPSYVGSAGDTIYVAALSPDMTLAIVFRFYPYENTANFYLTEWNQEVLAELEALCEDGFYVNSTDELLNIARQLYNSGN